VNHAMHIRFLPALAGMGLLAATTALVGQASPAAQKRPAIDQSVSDAWRAPASIVIDEQEIGFSDGSVQLSGTLYYPRGASKVPAIVVLHGASSPTRDLPLYRHLKEMLPPLGIAVYVFDRRGSGKSVTSADVQNLEVLSDDGVAAARMLAHDPRIDSARIGFWGVSQGGWLALMAAAKDADAAFVISVSAPMTTPDVQMNFAVANILRVNGYAQTDIDQAVDTRRKIDDYLRGKLDRFVPQQALDSARQRPWFKLIYLGSSLASIKTSSWPEQMRVDPMATLDRVKVPVLMIYGAADPWVPVRLSEERLRAVAPGHPNVETVVIAKADHMMMSSLSPKTQMDPKSFAGETPEVPAYFAALAAWLTQQHLAHISEP